MSLLLDALKAAALEKEKKLQRDLQNDNIEEGLSKNDEHFIGNEGSPPELHTKASDSEHDTQKTKSNGIDFEDGFLEELFIHSPTDDVSQTIKSTPGVSIESNSKSDSKPISESRKISGENNPNEETPDGIHNDLSNEIASPGFSGINEQGYKAVNLDQLIDAPVDPFNLFSDPTQNSTNTTTKDKQADFSEGSPSKPTPKEPSTFNIPLEVSTEPRAPKSLSTPVEPLIILDSLDATAPSKQASETPTPHDVQSIGTTPTPDHSPSFDSLEILMTSGRKRAKGNRALMLCVLGLSMGMMTLSGYYFYSQVSSQNQLPALSVSQAPDALEQTSTRLSIARPQVLPLEKPLATLAQSNAETPNKDATNSESTIQALSKRTLPPLEPAKKEPVKIALSKIQSLEIEEASSQQQSKAPLALSQRIENNEFKTTTVGPTPLETNPSTASSTVGTQTSESVAIDVPLKTNPLNDEIQFASPTITLSPDIPTLISQIKVTTVKLQPQVALQVEGPAAGPASTPAPTPIPAPTQTQTQTPTTTPTTIHVTTNNASQDGSPSVDAINNQAYRYFHQRNYIKAQSLYQQVLQLQPRNRDGLLGTAAIALNKGDSTAAAQIYTRLIRLDPNDITAKTALNSLHQSSDIQRHQAEILFQLREHPKSHALHFALGNLYAAMQNWQGAQSSFSNAWSIDGTNADYCYNLALSLDQLSQPKQALQLYQKSLALAQTHHNNLPRQQVQDRINQLTTHLRNTL